MFQGWRCSSLHCGLCLPSLNPVMPNSTHLLIPKHARKVQRAGRGEKRHSSVPSGFLLHQYGIAQVSRWTWFGYHLDIQIKPVPTTSISSRPQAPPSAPAFLLPSQTLFLLWHIPLALSCLLVLHKPLCLLGLFK